jgi:hypothetical protein
VADWIIFPWRIPSESGGAFNHIRVAACVGILNKGSGALNGEYGVHTVPHFFLLSYDVVFKTYLPPCPEGKNFFCNPTPVGPEKRTMEVGRVPSISPLFTTGNLHWERMLL